METVKGEIYKLAAEKRKDMGDTKSDLRNQVSKQDIIDFQLLSNTPAQVIIAMTGESLAELEKRAKELEVNLKGSLAGTING